MNRIVLEKMQFYAYHGFFKEEQIVGANYELTLALDVDFSLAGKSDQLADTLNYQSVYDVVKEQMNINSRLVEHVAQRIADTLLATYKQIHHIELSLSKLNPPLGGQVERVTIQLSAP